MSAPPLFPGSDILLLVMGGFGIRLGFWPLFLPQSPRYQVKHFFKFQLFQYRLQPRTVTVCGLVFWFSRESFPSALGRMARSRQFVAPFLVAASSVLSHAMQPQTMSAAFVACPQRWSLWPAQSLRAVRGRGIRLAHGPVCSLDGSKRKKKMRVDELLIEQGLAEDAKVCACEVIGVCIIPKQFS